MNVNYIRKEFLSECNQNLDSEKRAQDLNYVSFYFFFEEELFRCQENSALWNYALPETIQRSRS
jgi:hypothetical protein